MAIYFGVTAVGTKEIGVWAGEYVQKNAAPVCNSISVWNSIDFKFKNSIYEEWSWMNVNGNKLVEEPKS